MALLPVAFVFAPVFARSENMHAGPESIAFDRIQLAMRSFWLEPGASLWRPRTWTLDTNFPLGTAFLFALPRAFGLDSVLAARGLAGGAALVASLAVFRFHSRSAGPLVAGLAAASVWTVPPFIRGAVVSGEEAFFTAALMLAFLGLARSGRGWTILSVVAANGLVLFRLEGALLLPIYGAVALWARGRREGGLIALASGASVLLHLGLAWSITGDPLSFLWLAQGVTEATSSGQASLAPMEYLWVLGQQLGGSWVVLLSGAGVASAAARGGREGRLWAAAVLGVTIVYGLLTALGLLNALHIRYLVPPLALLSASVPLGLLALTGRAAALGRPAFCVLFAVLLHGGQQAAFAEAEAARLPPTVLQGSRWLGSCARGQLTLVTSHCPEIEVLGRLPPGSVLDLETDLTWPDPLPVRTQLERTGLTMLFLADQGDAAQAVLEVLPDDWHLVWSRDLGRIYTRAGGQERERLLECRSR